MKIMHSKSIFLVMFALSVATHAHADDFDLSWNTIDCGGQTSTGGTFEITATIAQADAGALAAGTFDLQGGFWAGAGGGASIDTCPADIAPLPNGNGFVNVDDLLFVINNWGAVGNNPADINHNQIVNVDDLLAVINGWGMCP